ncbi:MAG TPA: catechol 1,2-dioxygenase [Gemmatimonadaceae bacterium]|jgi:catechol 1,2-dioxygenase|nr:catechol 1,2-dioxygenase [Gemmatimonadaceae bacterium]
MSDSIARSAEMERFLDRVSGTDNSMGNPRVKQIVRRVVSDLYRMIEDLDISPDEFWTAVSYLTEAGQNREFGLLSPGLGFDHFLDLRMDATEREAGVQGCTPRTIEGPLYVAGAPLAHGEARLDDGTERGETLFMSGRVLSPDGNPVPGAIVEVWHANTLGNYSFFDESQSPYNLRRRIETDAEGRYGFRSIMPAGYGVPPKGSTEQLLDQLGRHGKRPAHIHFFVSASGYAHLTTQINIAGDPLLHDDFAFATRDELIPDVVRHYDPAEIRSRGLEAPFAEIDFDFILHPIVAAMPGSLVHRERMGATAT